MADESRSHWPCSFANASNASDPSIASLVEFFTSKGLGVLKQEDRQERWYDDWLAFQARHQIYASVLSPAKFSSLGHRFDLRKLVRFLEAFAYFSPGHGYSIQCTFLGLFPILMSDNEPLKREAIALLERGELFALGVSEQAHGSDLLGNEFTVRANGAGSFVANGSKYYIGNANVAPIITILAKRDDGQPRASRRSPMMLFAYRNDKTARKISTCGIRSGFVGAFDVADYEFPKADVIAEGRSAWDAVFGTIGLGKIFLGFGAIGICEHALEETWSHVNARMLYGKPVIQMPHIRLYIARAYARLAAMKFYAYRALDYFNLASEADRRYLLFAAVQKAKVSTDGVRVVDQLLECIGARGFESETYFEMALRDIRLLPVLEGSSHINFAMAAQFMQGYFNGSDDQSARPASSIASERSEENEYLFTARSASPKSVVFGDPSIAYNDLSHIPNVRSLVHQFNTFRAIAESLALSDDTETAVALGKCVSIFAFAQLVAEHVIALRAPDPIISLIFGELVADIGSASVHLASTGQGLSETQRTMLMDSIAQPSCDRSDIEFVIDWIAQHMT